MNITNLPRDPLIINENDIHPHWRVYLNQLTNQLQEFLSDERYKTPEQSLDNISQLEDLEKNKGGVVYNTSNNDIRLNVKNRYQTLPEDTVEYRFKTAVTYEEMTNMKLTQIPSGERNGRIIYVTDTGMTKLGVNNVFINL